MMIPAAAASASRLDELTGPVTIIAGSADLVVNPAGQSGQLAGALLQAKLLMVESAGHMVHDTASAEVASAIRQAAS